MNDDSPLHEKFPQINQIDFSFSQKKKMPKICMRLAAIHFVYFFYPLLIHAHTSLSIVISQLSMFLCELQKNRIESNRENKKKKTNIDMRDVFGCGCGCGWYSYSFGFLIIILVFFLFLRIDFRWANFCDSSIYSIFYGQPFGDSNFNGLKLLQIDASYSIEYRILKLSTHTHTYTSIHI